jgi:hypothetical protein
LERDAVKATPLKGLGGLIDPPNSLLDIDTSGSLYNVAEHNRKLLIWRQSFYNYTTKEYAEMHGDDKEDAKLILSKQ